jgi:hypothetical protein
MNGTFARTACGLALLLGVGVLTEGQAVRAAAVAGVLTGSPNTWDPSQAYDRSSSAGVLAWTVYRHGLPRAVLRIGTQPVVRLNRRGQAWAWSLDAGTTTAAYQQVRHGNSDLKLYDWTTGTRTSPGGTVNTSRWEYEPAVSGHWLVFGRLNRARTPDLRRILLDNLQTGTLVELARFEGSGQTGTLSSPHISGDWVTWTAMGHGYQRSIVHRYRISTGQDERIPQPDGWFDYLSTIGPDGTVYFLRSLGGCGHRVTFESYTTGGVLTALGSMPAGRDGGDEMSAAPQPDGIVDLYFDSYRCTQSPPNGNIDVLRLSLGAVAERLAGAVAVTGDQPKHIPAWLRTMEAIR